MTIKDIPLVPASFAVITVLYMLAVGYGLYVVDRDDLYLIRVTAND